MTAERKTTKIRLALCVCVWRIQRSDYVVSVWLVVSFMTWHLVILVSFSFYLFSRYL